MKASKLFFLLIIFPASLINAQNRAPSCWLNYADNFKGDIIMNTVRVANPSPLYTYYCTMQWNAGQEAGGYCGIQEHPDGRNFIFSIWDPISSNEAIKPAYVGPGTETANFGGEGTGLRSLNFDLGWETLRWYTFVSRAWDYHGHTHFGYWIFDQHGKEWHHLITMDFPVEGIRFSTGTGSFIEDWLGNGQNKRSVHHKEGWKRYNTSKRWKAFETARFSRVSPDAGAANYINNYNGGVAIDTYYFMESGGASSPVTNQSGSTLRLDNPANRPDFASVGIEEFEYQLDNELLSLQWERVDSTSAQFSFSIELINQSLADSSIFSQTLEIPHLRAYDLDLSGYPDGDYRLLFHLTDIFDQESDTLVKEFSFNSSSALIHADERRGFVKTQSGMLDVELPDGKFSYRVISLSGRLLHKGNRSTSMNLNSLPDVFTVLVYDDKTGRILESLKFVNLFHN